jgi:Arc/MetJ-type ribon-helix-helix transcriptional regulator
MARPITSADLPPDLARFAEAQVAAGRFESVEDVLRAGKEALEHELETPPPPHDWNDYLRYRFEEGRKAFARGEAVELSVDELMDGIESELGIRAGIASANALGQPPSSDDP